MTNLKEPPAKLPIERRSGVRYCLKSAPAHGRKTTLHNGAAAVSNPVGRRITASPAGCGLLMINDVPDPASTPPDEPEFSRFGFLGYEPLRRATEISLRSTT